jgi:hypothetical protein
MSTTTPVTYINYRGEPIGPVDHGGGVKRKRTPTGPDDFHKGFRVVGLPPGSLLKAEQDHAKEIARVREHNAEHPSNQIRAPKPWDADHWLANARGTPVRAKPYELRDAAEQCKQLAEKAGWLRVWIVELKRESGV